jgi:predicted RecB family nuclease
MQPWKSKFNVSPPDQRRAFGRTYASKAEKEYAEFLYRAVALRDVRLVLEQVGVWLGVPENTYRPDFFVVNGDGSYEFVDVKGVETPAFKRIVRLWESYGPCSLRVIRKKGKSFATAYVVEGGNAWSAT